MGCFKCVQDGVHLLRPCPPEVQDTDVIISCGSTGATFFAAAAYGSSVSAVTVLTQKPTVVSLSRGESVTMDCNLGTSTDAGYWYKQIHFYSSVNIRLSFDDQSGGGRLSSLLLSNMGRLC
ncbi:hypothetical protein D4764_18G0008940 [Takifugu flavidus]|uniref:Ig-like domain-containing protein n=1 Tax=Takifugu flavidus TaxID=433684 RepID=A0A5C6NTG1_9TELE|nr:hypothetical protein D4764_18G0008940 [Takifugu flavidus]